MKEFREAAFKGNIIELQNLIERQKTENGGINQAGEGSGKTALHRAVEGNHIEVVKWLIQNGANVNAIDSNGQGSLHFAARNINVDMVKFLQEKGAKTLANLNLQEGSAKTPLMETLPFIRKIAEKYKSRPSNTLLRKLGDIEELITIFKSSINTESAELAKNPLLKIEAIYLDEHGMFFCGSKRKILAIKNVGNSANLSTINLETNKQKFFSYEGKSLENPLFKVKSHYFIPPLVFCVNHLENATFELISRNFEFFKKMGYSRLCFEYDRDKNLSEVMKIFSSFIVDVEQNQFKEKISKETIEWVEAAKLHLNFFEKVQQQKWLKYVGIDDNFGELRNSYFSRWFLSDEATDSRNTQFAKTITLESNKTNGGTISIVGVGHQALRDKLIEYGSNSAFSCQFYFCYSSKNFDDGNNKEGSETIHLENRIITPTLINLNVQSGFLEAEEKLKANVYNAILKENKKIKYEKYLTEDTRNLQILKKLFNLPFVGVMDKDYYVDALLYLKDISQYEETVERIYKTMDLEKPIFPRKNEKNELVLTIPHINSENANAIGRASKQKKQHFAMGSSSNN